MGVRWAEQRLPLVKVARQITGPALLVVPVLLAMRYVIGRGVELGRYEICFDKWHLGVVRLIDFTAVGVLLVRGREYLRGLAIRPLVVLGQSSLQVFCTHLFFCFAGLTLLGNASMLSGGKQGALLAATLFAMWFTARLFAKTGLQGEGVRPPSLPKTTAIAVPGLDPAFPGPPRNSP